MLVVFGWLLVVIHVFSVHNSAVLQAHQSINLDRSDLYAIFTIWKCYIIIWAHSLLLVFLLHAFSVEFRCCFCFVHPSSICLQANVLLFVSVKNSPLSSENTTYTSRIWFYLIINLLHLKFFCLRECEFFPLRIFFFWFDFLFRMYNWNARKFWWIFFSVVVDHL